VITERQLIVLINCWFIN